MSSSVLDYSVTPEGSVYVALVHSRQNVLTTSNGVFSLLLSLLVTFLPKVVVQRVLKFCLQP